MIRSTGAEQPITQNPHPRERVWLAATTNADSPFAAASARRANRGHPRGQRASQRVGRQSTPFGCFSQVCFVPVTTVLLAARVAVGDLVAERALRVDAEAQAIRRLGSNAVTSLRIW
jgi:hypothetical protein